MSKLVRRVVTPERVKVGILATFVGSMLTGMAANLVAVWSLVRGPQLPPQFPPQPVPTVAPTPDPTREAMGMQSFLEMPRSLGAAASPRRMQFENHISVSQGGKTIVMPPHTGTVDAILGPVALQVPAGETVAWDPFEGLAGIEAETHLIVGFSNVPAEDSTHAVEMWGTGDDAPDPEDIRALDPVAYVPEALSLPVHFRNATGQDAVVTLLFFANTEEGGGPGPDF